MSDDIERLAREATQGPWYAAENLLIGGYVVSTLPGDNECRASVADFMSREDAAYIAAVNPQVGLALIERVRTLTAQLHATALAEHRLREALTAVRTDWLLFARPHSDDIQGTINDIAQSALATPPTEGAQQVAALIAAAKEALEAQRAPDGYFSSTNINRLNAAHDALAAALKVLQ